MIQGPRRLTRRLTRRVPRLLVAATLVLLPAACATTAPSPSSPASAAPTSAAPTAAAPTAAATPTSPATSPATSPSPVPVPSASATGEATGGSSATGEATGSSGATTACAIVPETGRLPSDRLVDVVVSSSAAADLVTFVFDSASVGGPGGPPQGSLSVAEAPYTEGASGQPIEMAGEHVAQVRFSGMALSNDVGEPTYSGASELQPGLPALRHVVNYDMFEGVVGWYIGYDGPGCLTLATDGRDVTVAVDRP